MTRSLTGPSNCFDLGSGDTAAADCKRINLSLEDETQRNQPPSTNQISTQLDQ